MAVAQPRQGAAAARGAGRRRLLGVRPDGCGVRGYPLMFLIPADPAVVGPALRRRGATLAAPVTSVIAIAGTLQGFGPFAVPLPTSRCCCCRRPQRQDGHHAVARRRIDGTFAVEQEIRELNWELPRQFEARTEYLKRLDARLVEAQQVAHIGTWEWDVTVNAVRRSDEMYVSSGLRPGSPMTYDVTSRWGTLRIARW